MPFEITMPQLGLTMETGTLLNWLVGAGDRFVPGREIFEVETDKATVAVEAHQEGIIERVLVRVVVNLPECCILGVGRFVRKPVAAGGDDAVVVRPMMVLSLAFDHRVIDGAPAARFLDRIAKLVEDPLLLL